MKNYLIILLLFISLGFSQKEYNYNDIINMDNGLWTFLYENGKKSQEGTYKDGKEDGLFTQWYENGKKQSEVTFKDGKVISSKEWNKDGSVKE